MEQIEDMGNVKPYEQLEQEVERLRQQLEEAQDTIEAIKNGEIDALVVQGKNGHELFTLKSADHTYRIFIEKMTEGAVTLNADGVIIYSNPSFASIVGDTSGVAVSETFEKFVIPADVETYRQLITEGWKNDVKGELSLFQHDTIIPVQQSITSLKMDEADTLSVIITDLTSQKEILRELKAKNEELASMNLALELSNNDLQQFASVASHDLQEPLRKIQIFSHLLRDKFHTELSETPRHYIDKITSAANRMKALIVDILNYSRLSAKDNQFERTDLKVMIQELLDDLEFTIKEKNATIMVGDLPEVEVNRGQMRQVLQNIISNAIKFSKKDTDPVIEIFHRKLSYNNNNNLSPAVFCQLHIKDNGIGFDSKYSKAIFNLFEKLHSKDDYEGTGIGLAIAKKIIEKHRGTIKVSSKIGEGTEFIISLPIEQNMTAR
jgi:two-component system CheB/CheR fusion protein